MCEEEETRTPTTQLPLPPQSSASTNSATSPTFKYHFEYLCPRQDSNLHVEKHTHLKRARLPIPPLGLDFNIPSLRYQNMSGKRDSDPRPQPWQGCALPTELFPLVHFREVKRRRLELPRHNCHYPLKVARLPIPPPLRSQKLRIQSRIPVVSKC